MKKLSAIALNRQDKIMNCCLAMKCAFMEKCVWGKESDKKTAEHFQKLTIPLRRSGCSEAGSSSDKACYSIPNYNSFDFCDLKFDYSFY